MGLTWVREGTPLWDATKQSILGGQPTGALEIPKLSVGDLAPGEWFRGRGGRTTLGYGWMDCTRGDAEITLAVDPRRQSEGVGALHHPPARKRSPGAGCQLPLQRRAADRTPIGSG